MKRINLRTLYSFFVFCIIVTSCGSKNVRLEDVPSTEYRGFLIQEPRGGLDIRKPLDFIMINEPLFFRLLKKHVKKIEYSAYLSNRNFPYYDIIIISQFTLERGEAHSASVLLHELFHIILNTIRRNRSHCGIDEKTFLLKAGIKYDDIKGMKKNAEERAAYLFQYGFIKQYGTERDIDYQRQKLEKLGIH